MSWTPITGKADYTNGKTVTPGPGATGTQGFSDENPWNNPSGSQDVGTYYEGNKGKTIVPDPGNSGLTTPTASTGGN